MQWEHTYGVPQALYTMDDTKLVIGRFCSIGSAVRIFLGGNHRCDWVTTYPFTAMNDVWPEVTSVPGHPSSNGDVVIGNDVWLSDCCTIMSGVTIGDGAVVGAAALVARDVPPYAVVGGNPAKLIRFRFEPAIIRRLQHAAWWDWDIADLRALLPLLVSDRIEEFLIAAEPIVAAFHERRVARAMEALAQSEAALARARAEAAFVPSTIASNVTVAMRDRKAK